jgi:hypothetical protein
MGNPEREGCRCGSGFKVEGAGFRVLVLEVPKVLGSGFWFEPQPPKEPGTQNLEP